MKGFIKKAAQRTLRRTLAGLVFGVGSMALTGCTQYRQHVDPCWPERYDNLARQTVRATFDAQCANGHVLDQTIWNWDFEKDDKGNPTDKLTIAGQDRLKYLMRRRPVPDGRIYLQTANDLPAGTDIATYPAKRQELDTARMAMVQKHLNAYMAGRAVPVSWDIAVHDPEPVYLPARGLHATPTSINAFSTLNVNGITGVVNSTYLLNGPPPLLGIAGSTGAGGPGMQPAQQGSGPPQAGAPPGSN
jgi:hypothetical protein